MSQIRKIRWILEHTPIDLFVRTARAFDEKIRELTNDTVQVEIYSAKEFAEKFYSVAAPAPNALAAVNSGDANVTQVEIQWVGSSIDPDFFALEMPYLFTDHDHATRVLDGEIGRNLLGRLEKTSSTKGLAFTYSGGYRVFASKEPIMTAEDFKQITCVGNFNPVRIDTVAALGCNVIPYSPSDANRAGLIGSVGTVETTLPRYEYEAYKQGCTHVSLTDHSMFLTTILINKDFFESLTPEQQASIQVAAEYVSKLERQWTVDESQTIERDQSMHDRMGIEIHRFSPEETSKLKDMVSPLYAKYRHVFTPNLIDNMLTA